MRPHRHRRDGSGTGFECFLVLQGAIGLLLFNSEGEIQKQLRHNLVLERRRSS